MSYSGFIKNKELNPIISGFDPNESLMPPDLKPHQKACVEWACRRGRSALFLDTGLGKTLCQLAWSQQVCEETGGSVLILAPLAVSHQTKREADHFMGGYPVSVVADDSEIDGQGIFITNYEKLSHFDVSQFAGVVLDESSILKGIDGKTRKRITTEFKETPYKLSCTATPSPNDFIELGTQCEFLGIMSQVEMLAMFFIHDGGDTAKWRLKGHGKTKFWEWLATWSVFIQSPADLGFDGTDYELPDIYYESIVIDTEPVDSLFAEPALSLVDRNRARKNSINDRCARAAEIANSVSSCVIWCNLNRESELLSSYIDGAVEVKGSDKDDHKTASLLGFATGEVTKLVSKPKIAGFGMNWQSSNVCIFVGLSDSWESFYQAIRRQWRYGQDKPVTVYIISADTEGAVVENIRRKDEQHKEMMDSMMSHMRALTKKNVLGAKTEKTDYFPSVDMVLPEWMK